MLFFINKMLCFLYALYDWSFLVKHPSGDLMFFQIKVAMTSKAGVLTRSTARGFKVDLEKYT